VKEYFLRAIANVTRYGDTDIFPFPIENHVFHDMKESTVALLQDIHTDFQKELAAQPPSNDGALAPMSYMGFRWATQIDPIWNLYFLSLVLSIADNIEADRIPKEHDTVFSYRYHWNDADATIFDNRYNWRTFMENSIEKSENYAYVVICDVSEFYSRVGHHRLENALAHLQLKGDVGKRIIGFLSNFSGTNSFGLPVGGPAARLLSELVLNQVDQLLKLEGVAYCRFSDDYHIFAESMEDGFAKLLLLTEKLQRTQGLQLQKSKTRIMSSIEFKATSPLRIEDQNNVGISSDSSTDDKARSLLRFSIRFDPYSPTAEEDYEILKREIEKFNIVAILQAELAKSRIHVSLAKKIVSVISYLDPKQRESAIISLLENANLLYPIFSTVLVVVKQTFNDLSSEGQDIAIRKILSLIQEGSHILKVDIVLAFAVRVLACRPSAGVQEALVQLYNSPRSSPLVRRDIILAMTRLRAWEWLSDRRAHFRSMSPSERRAFIVASYSLMDEGKHWRKHISGEWTPLERLVRDWVCERVGRDGWTVPI
jgi:hypothetical protein